MNKRNKKRNKALYPEHAVYTGYTSFDQSAKKNMDAYNYYWWIMVDVLLNRIRFLNLPEYLDERYLNWLLVFNGSFAGFYDNIMGQAVTLPWNTVGRLEMYLNPRRIRAYSQSGNGYRVTLHRGEFAIVWANQIRVPDIVFVDRFTERMAQTLRTADVNLENQKTPKVISAEETQRLTMENIAKDIEGNVNTIYVRKGFDADQIRMLDLTAPYVVDKLDVHLNTEWNRFLTWAGYENANADKKERLVAGEVGANMGDTEMNRNRVIRTVNEGLKHMNRICGTDITAEFNSDLPTPLNAPETIRGEDNGKIHDQLS